MDALQNRDPVSDDCCYRHMNNGYTEPGMAMHMADRLLAGVQQETAPTGVRRMMLAAGLLRQALLLNPVDTALRDVVRSLCAVQPPSTVFGNWLATSEHALSGEPDVPMGDVMERVGLLAQDDEVLFKGALRGDSPAYRFACLGVLWEVGNNTYFVKAAQRIIQDVSGEFVAQYCAWGALRLGDVSLCRTWLGRAVGSPLTLHMYGQLAGEYWGACRT